MKDLSYEFNDIEVTNIGESVFNIKKIYIFFYNKDK